MTSAPSQAQGTERERALHGSSGAFPSFVSERLKRPEILPVPWERTAEPDAAAEELPHKTLELLVPKRYLLLDQAGSDKKTVLFRQLSGSEPLGAQRHGRRVHLAQRVG